MKGVLLARHLVELQALMINGRGLAFADSYGMGL